MPTSIGIAKPEEELAQDLETIGSVLNNPAVRAVGAWHCSNHDDPMDDGAYVEKSVADLEAFSAKLDEALALL